MYGQRSSTVRNTLVRCPLPPSVVLPPVELKVVILIGSVLKTVALGQYLARALPSHSFNNRETSRTFAPSRFEKRWSRGASTILTFENPLGASDFVWRPNTARRRNLAARLFAAGVNKT